MQTVSGLFSGFGGGAGGGLSSGFLGAARFGTSALSALSGYAMSRQNADALNLEATNERLAARGDYLQAQEKTNDINRAYDQTIGSQLATASAGGIDIGSGSVQEAGRQAGQQRDRMVRAAQTGAEVDARLRTARAGILDASAASTRTTGLLSTIADVAKAGLQYSQLGRN